MRHVAALKHSGNAHLLGQPVLVRSFAVRHDRVRSYDQLGIRGIHQIVDEDRAFRRQHFAKAFPIGGAKPVEQRVDGGQNGGAIVAFHRRRHGSGRGQDKGGSKQRKRHGDHILKMPNAARSVMGASSEAASARPSTSRVCAGSITPSSHRRAVA